MNILRSTFSMPKLLSSLQSCVTSRYISATTSVLTRTPHKRRWVAPPAETVFMNYRGMCYNTKENLVLMGSPGSGKTTVGRVLAAELKKKAVDVDNDFLESHWGMTVAEKLSHVGGDRFVEAEGEAFLEFDAKNSVISLTGSNPMYEAAAKHMKKLGVVVFLDVQDKDILHRLEIMKVNRIVGQMEGTPMADILQYRQQFYEGNYDIRVICEPQEPPESIAKKIVHALNVYNENKGYKSTRSSEEDAHNTTFEDVVLQGLAPDGGLYIPSGQLPSLTVPQIGRLVGMSYQNVALRILEKYLHPSSLSANSLRGMIDKAYNQFECSDICPIIPLRCGQFISELFHGPTASFKDLALQLMPHFFQHALHSARTKGNIGPNAKFLILVATSGDTGGAVLYGYRDLAKLDESVRVMVLYPEEGVSDIQKLQMKTVPTDGVHVLGVESDFDFCQSTIKDIFKQDKDSVLSNYGYKLTAANSINWGRLLPQVVYHVWNYVSMVSNQMINLGDTVDLTIPTGNFGNILAAIYAKRLGVPFGRLICASNENNILTEFFTSGVYDLRQRSLHVTEAPAIDILKSSNLERYLHMLSGTAKVKACFEQLERESIFKVDDEVTRLMRRDIDVGWCNVGDALTEARDTFKKTGYLMDPHTAVAKVVADRFQGDRPMLIAATAHYAKFADALLGSLRQEGEGVRAEEKMEILRRLASRPVPHESLLTAVQQPLLHTSVVTASREAVMREVGAFLGA